MDHLAAAVLLNIKPIKLTTTTTINRSIHAAMVAALVIQAVATQAVVVVAPADIMAMVATTAIMDTMATMMDTTTNIKNNCQYAHCYAQVYA